MSRTDVPGAAWFKSSRSSGRSDCIEVAVTAGSKEGSDHVIVVRDSKNPGGPQLVFTPAEWEAFTAGVRDGEFDID